MLRHHCLTFFVHPPDIFCHPVLFFRFKPPVIKRLYHHPNKMQTLVLWESHLGLVFSEFFVTAQRRYGLSLIFIFMTFYDSLVISMIFYDFVWLMMTFVILFDIFSILKKIHIMSWHSFLECYSIHKKTCRKNELISDLILDSSWHMTTLMYFIMR